MSHVTTAACTPPTATRRRRRAGATRARRRFARHYLEMVLAMIVGMLVLDLPLDATVELLGARPDTWRDSAPALAVLAMGVTMTVPMAAWMRVRRHRARAIAEMSGAMLVPTAASAAILASGATSAVGAVFAVEHVAIFVGMLAVMLWRREEYVHDRGC